MNLKKLFAAAFFISSAVIARPAETNSAAAWQALTNFSLPNPPMEWQTNPPTSAQLGKFDDEQVAMASAQADRARKFYLEFPNDENSARARTTEIEALQLAVHFGATNRVADLDAREQTVIENTNAPEELRYELRLDQVGRDLQTAKNSGADMDATMEQIGRSLVKDFPDGSAGYEILVDQAENGDLLKMHDLAQVMAASGGPKELTDLGKSLLNQINAVGEPLPVDFKNADGREINSATLSNKVVLVDFWATWCPVCVEAMPDVKKLYAQYHTNGLEIVGINFDDDAKTAEKFIQQNDLPWPQFFGGYGADNKYGRDYGEALPYVWLVDKKGIIRDIHGRMDTEAKIKKLLAE